MARRNGEERRWLVVVRRDKSDLYLKLRHSFEPDPRVTVIFDRRLADRRVDDTGPAETERRRYERRTPPTITESGAWETAGSRLIET